MANIIPYIDYDQRKKISQEILDNSEQKVSFYALSGLSAIIVTLGLIINSASVVIGAMLIAPLFWPMIAISLSVATGKIGLFKKMLWIFGRTILGIVALAMIVSIFSPIRDASGSEILSRTNPNLIHFFIALFSGITGAFAVIWPGLSSSLAGVLIATALVPPLGVVGYSLVLGNLSFAWGAFLLFLTNAVVIVFVGVVMLLFFGFKPRHLEKEESEDLLRKELLTFTILIMILIIPLTYSLFDVVSQNRVERITRSIILEQLDHLKYQDISQLTISRSAKLVKITMTLKTETVISNTQIARLKAQLENQLKRRVELEIDLIEIRRI